MTGVQTCALPISEKMRSYFLLKQNAEWLDQRRKKVAEYRKKNGRKPETANPEVKKDINSRQKVKFHQMLLMQNVELLS